MADTNPKTDTNLIVAFVVTAVGALLLLGWFLFPNWQ
jgi:hypothetical protein